MKTFLHDMDEVTLIRSLCAALAAVVVVDAISVGAPGLGLLAVPYIAGAVFFREGKTVGTIALGLFAALFAVLGVNYAASNGFDAGWGDLLFAYVGTAIAVAIIGFDVHHRVEAMHHHNA
jgi:hypothetical protein